MLFGLFRRKDPICGMKEEKGKGLECCGKWFCSNDCKTKYQKNKPKEKSGCCGGHDANKSKEKSGCCGGHDKCTV
ncbi:MAG: hypothetical protein AABX39_06700 [Nanoarchaeota archaeon]